VNWNCTKICVLFYVRIVELYNCCEIKVMLPNCCEIVVRLCDKICVCCLIVRNVLNFRKMSASDHDDVDLMGGKEVRGKI